MHNLSYGVLTEFIGWANTLVRLLQARHYLANNAQLCTSEDRAWADVRGPTSCMRLRVFLQLSGLSNPRYQISSPFELSVLAMIFARVRQHDSLIFNGLLFNPTASPLF